MNEVDDFFEKHLPSVLLRTDKDRIKDGLSQFFPQHNIGVKDYNYFYLTASQGYFMQGDIINSLPVVSWNGKNSAYETAFSPVMLISNSCDVTPENDRINKKEALFAPVIPLNEYFKNLADAGISKEQINSLHNEFKNQKITNVYYLPPNPINKEEYVVFLDKICWHPSEEFSKKLSGIESERFISLAHFGYYLLILKLSIHFCRVPEEIERTPSAA